MGKIKGFLKMLYERNSGGLLVVKREGRFGVTRTGYRFDRWLFRIALVVIFLVLGMTYFHVREQGAPWRELYVNCPMDTPYPGCLNPYYKMCDETYCMGVIDIQTFHPGEIIGRPPNKALVELVWKAQVAAFILFGVAIMLNHFLYNRGKVPIELPDEEVADEKQRK